MFDGTDDEEKTTILNLVALSLSGQGLRGNTADFGHVNQPLPATAIVVKIQFTSKVNR